MDTIESHMPLCRFLVYPVARCAAQGDDVMKLTCKSTRSIDTHIDIGAVDIDTLPSNIDKKGALKV